MAKHLNRKVDEMSYDRLIVGTTPPVKTASGVIARLTTAATYRRGTVLCRSTGAGGDGKLKILGSAAASDEILTPDCILCDDEDMGTTEDSIVVTYVGGDFNLNALITAEGYTITQADRDKLRERGIYLSMLWD